MGDDEDDSEVAQRIYTLSFDSLQIIRDYSEKLRAAGRPCSPSDVIEIALRNLAEIRGLASSEQPERIRGRRVGGNPRGRQQ